MSALTLPWPGDQSPTEDREPVFLPFRSASSPPPNVQLSTLTVDQAWKEIVRPQMTRPRSQGGRARDTVGEYETHVRRWLEFWTAESRKRLPQDGMTNPVLVKIGYSTLERWRDWLIEHPEGLSNRTVNKHLSSIQTIGSIVARRNDLPPFPRLEPLAATAAGRKLHLSYAEAAAIKEACRVATWPAGLDCPAPLLWESAFVGWCIYGFRTQEQVRNDSSMPTLTWDDNVRLQEETPHPDGKATWSEGWLIYTPHKQSRLKPEPLVLPIVKAYSRHIRLIRNLSGSTGPIFPFPLSNQSFYEQWAAIVAEAGVKPKPGFDGVEAKYQVKHLRKTASRWLNDHGAEIGCPGIGDYITGHASDRSPDGEKQSKVVRQHYDFPEDRILRTLTTLPLPPSFLHPLYGERRQMRLF